MLVAQVRTIADADVTVNVAEQVLVVSQVLVTVHVTILDPPQAAGAPVELLDTDLLHPPPLLNVPSHVA